MKIIVIVTMLVFNRYRGDRETIIKQTRYRMYLCILCALQQLNILVAPSIEAICA